MCIDMLHEPCVTVRRHRVPSLAQTPANIVMAHIVMAFSSTDTCQYETSVHTHKRTRVCVRSAPGGPGPSSHAHTPIHMSTTRMSTHKHACVHTKSTHTARVDDLALCSTTYGQRLDDVALMWPFASPVMAYIVMARGRMTWSFAFRVMAYIVMAKDRMTWPFASPSYGLYSYGQGSDDLALRIPPRSLLSLHACACPWTWSAH